jgi:hypothetical protein
LVKSVFRVSVDKTETRVRKLNFTLDVELSVSLKLHYDRIFSRRATATA